MIKSKNIRYSLEKNELLKIERDISFEDVILAIENGNLLDDIKHPNEDKYPNQNVFIILVKIKDYVYLVPYVEDETSIFLKTIIPSIQMNKKYNKSWVVFQPHTYSRTKTLLNDFAKALLNFDNIIVTDIYAARETNRYGVSSQDLVDKINSLGKKAIYIQNFDDIINYLKENVKENDIILTLGAGTVTQISDKIVEEN